MTFAERQQLKKICRRIVNEQDRATLLAHFQELQRFFDEIPAAATTRLQLSRPSRRAPSMRSVARMSPQ
jgi:hypothetical protein